jgi:predicted acyltransferase
MKKSLKGALISGLVIPGMGQIFLKGYKRGAILILMISVGMLIFVLKAVEQAFIILENIESAGGVLDMNAILNAAAVASTSPANSTMNYALSFIFICWLYSIVDAYLLGRRIDREMGESG